VSFFCEILVSGFHGVYGFPFGLKNKEEYYDLGFFWTENSAIFGFLFKNSEFFGFMCQKFGKY
jgi:hypothetical protein